MSSLPPERQGLGGGILSTVIKLSITMGLAISSSVYTAQSSGEVVFETTDKPYHAAFWVCTAAAALGVCIFPFVTIGTQGNVEKDVEK